MKATLTHRLLRFLIIALCLPVCRSSTCFAETAFKITSQSKTAAGVHEYVIESPLQSSPTQIRILLPKELASGIKYPVVYVLPVEAQRESRYGDGLAEVLKYDLQNQYQAIFVAPTFSMLPWYADHPTKTNLKQEQYFKEVVVPFVEEHFPAIANKDGRLLLGFSKSGWGAWTLLLRNPDMFGKAAAWDAPLMMKEVGRYGNGPIFGTQENFAAYRVDQLVSKASQFGVHPRLLLTGYGNFRQHHQQVHELLEQLQVPHIYLDGPHRKHDWHSGWVSEAVKLLMENQ